MLELSLTSLNDTLWQINKKLWKDPPCLMGKNHELNGPCSIAM